MQKRVIPKPTLPKTTTLRQAGFGVVIYAVVLGIIVALIAGYYETSFKFLAGFWHETNTLLTFVPRWVLYGVGVFLACPILYVILQRISEKRPHNPTDLITGIHIYNGNINAKDALLSAFASIFSIGFGFSVGYYAPAVQLGAGVGAIMHKLKWIRPAYCYISIGAGAAAAIAAIFQSPIGAVVFVHEVLFRFFSIRAFAPITIAAVTSYIVSNELFDKVIFFDISSHYKPETPTYFVAAFAGVIAAVVGITIIRAIIRLQQAVKDKAWGMMNNLLIAAALTAVIIIAVPQVAGSSLQSMHGVIDGTTFALTTLLGIFVAKILATTVAFGFGIPGGIFGPTLFIGAALGGLIAGVVEIYYPHLVSAEQIIIITTMAAMISAVLGAPIAMILIVVEITGDFEIISVVMLAVVMANITAYRFMGTSSFFDIQLKLRGFDFEVGRDRLYAEHQSIHDLITSDYLALPKQTDLVTAEKQLVAANRNVAFVIDDEGNLRGQVRLVDIEYYRREAESATTEPLTATLANVTHKDIAVVYRATSIWKALEIITQANVNFVPVIDTQTNPKLLGVVYNNTLIARYLTFVHRLRTQENAVK